MVAHHAFRQRSHFLVFFRLAVCLSLEVREECEHRRDVHEIHHGQTSRVRAVPRHEKRTLHEHAHKLNELQVCNRFLQQRRDVHVQRCDHIIRVHDEMNKPVKYDGEIDVAVVSGIQQQPIERKYRGMMVD